MLQRKFWTEEGETKEPGEFVLAGRIQFLCGGKITAKIRCSIQPDNQEEYKGLLSQVCDQRCNLKKNKKKTI